MRLTYPRSFLSMLLIGFALVAAPLLFALLSNALAFERLAGLSEQAVHSAVKVTQASRSLLGTIASLERSARQYAVAGEATFLEAYRTHRAALQGTIRQLNAMALSDAQRAERSIEVTVVASERLACVTRTAECTACSDMPARRSKASAFDSSANSRGAATMMKPSSSSDRKERG